MKKYATCENCQSYDSCISNLDMDTDGVLRWTISNIFILSDVPKSKICGWFKLDKTKPLTHTCGDEGYVMDGLKNYKRKDNE